MTQHRSFILQIKARKVKYPFQQVLAKEWYPETVLMRPYPTKQTNILDNN